MSSLEGLYKLTSELIKIKSITPVQGEGLKEASSFIKEWLKDKGFDAEVKEFYVGFPVVVASNKKEPLKVMLNGHFDVVPVGDLNKWSDDPFSGKVFDDKIFGRGATDMKGGLAVQMMVFTELADKVDYGLMLVAVPDEEIGGEKGSKIIAEQYRPEVVLVAEPSTSTSMNVAEKGLFQVKLTAKGKSAHGSLPSLGENAVMKIVDDLKSLSRITETKISVPKEMEEVIKDTLEMINSPDVLRISFNPGVIRGGSKINMVPDYCEVEVDMRLPPGITTKEAEKVLKSLVKNSSYEFIDLSEPNYTSPKEKYVILLENTIFKVLNVKPKKYMTTGATDGRYFRLKGIPTIIYGPGELGVAHSYNEYISFKELKNSYEVYKEYLLTLNHK